MTDELLSFYKALADANRLKIVGLLSARSYSVEELAALLDLRPSTVSHHLARLAEAGLVSAHTESYYNVYSLEEHALEERTRRLLSRQDFAAAIAEMDLDGYDRKVIADYSRRDGSLKTIPAQRKKLEAVLRYVVRVFEPGKRYSEHKVNEMLSRFHADTATLRRELVGYGLMQREGGGGSYWRPRELGPGDRSSTLRSGDT
ncbi:MAG TPA: metalloregulator ArsR/SmtB family transcription factor [Anaerolineales bacterium]|nr:metalloregulator ArsR/SmtB family transcription factor [Anaerolineales bacterium]